MELIGKKINFLGDSITQGVGASSEDKIYLNRLKEMAELSCVRNYGISGTRLAKQSEFDGLVPFTERFQGMDDDADIIVVFGGTNDYGHGDAKIGTLDDRTNDTFYGACHFMMEGLIKKYPDSEIVIMTPLHRSDDMTKNQSNNATLKDYVDIIKEVAAIYGLPVLDLYTMSGIQPDVECIKEKYMPDGLHPSDAGNQRIADRLYGFLKSL